MINFAPEKSKIILTITNISYQHLFSLIKQKQFISNEKQQK